MDDNNQGPLRQARSSLLAVYNMSSSSISVMARGCMRQFSGLLKLLDVKSDESNFGFPRVLLCDEFDRFKLWAGNIGATLNPQSKASLDDRLRASSQVARLVLDCLRDLEISLSTSMPSNPFCYQRRFNTDQ